MKDTLVLENIRFYNLTKLRRAQAIAGDDVQAVLEEYKKMAGKYDIIEAEKPKKVAKKRAKKVPKKKSS